MKFFSSLVLWQTIHQMGHSSMKMVLMCLQKWPFDSVCIDSDIHARNIYHSLIIIKDTKSGVGGGRGLRNVSQLSLYWYTLDSKFCAENSNIWINVAAIFLLLLLQSTCDHTMHIGILLDFSHELGSHPILNSDYIQCRKFALWHH